MTDYGYLEKIQNEDLKNFVKEMLSKHSTEDKIKKSKKVAETLWKMLRKKKQISDNTTPTWVDLLLSACAFYNVFYDGTLTSIFKAREVFVPIILERELLPINAISAIFQTVEAQLGTDMPVESCQPQGDSPNTLFAWAVWSVEEMDEENPRPLPTCCLLS